MLNLDGEQTSLKSLAANTHDNLKNVNSKGNLIYLNLWKVRMTPPYFYLSALT